MIKDGNVNWIVNNKCKKDKKTICNIGYACDGCPYNKKSDLKMKKYNLNKLVKVNELLRRIQIGKIIHSNKSTYVKPAIKAINDFYDKANQELKNVKVKKHGSKRS